MMAVYERYTQEQYISTMDTIVQVMFWILSGPISITVCGNVGTLNNFNNYLAAQLNIQNTKQIKLLTSNSIRLLNDDKPNDNVISVHWNADWSKPSNYYITML